MASGSGSFAAVMEITDSMRQSRKMDYAFVLAIIWIMLLVIPHTTAVVLAYPHQALKQGGQHCQTLHLSVRTMLYCPLITLSYCHVDLQIPSRQSAGWSYLGSRATLLLFSNMYFFPRNY